MGNDDLTPDWLASLDQMNAGLRDLAKAVRNYYVMLIENGFAPEQAVMLAGGFQHTLIMMPAAQQSDEPGQNE